MIINKKCQVFTPENNVQQLLDCIEYNNGLYNKKVAENSCGDGNILSAIVVRYIEDCVKNKISKRLIKKGLERDVFGAEIDKEHIDKCISKLDEIARKYDVTNVKWQIYHGDFLKLNLNNEFDFVIGNPPYIAYPDLTKETQNFVKENFSVCSHGKFDYCYAFIQAGINSLTEQGKLVYLIPGNIFKNQFAKLLREMLLPHLTNIYDFTNLKLFKNKLTSSAIIVYDKSKIDTKIKYHDMINDNNYVIKKSELNSKWIFNMCTNILSHGDGIKFGDVFHAASSVATLLNKVFIVSDYTIAKDYIIINDHKIERSILRNAASPRSLNYEKEEFVVFPYYYKDSKVLRFAEDEFREKYPFATRYLLSHKLELDERDSDNGVLWFEYGRSQALTHLNQKKILTSTLITNKVKAYMLDSDTIPTSGLYIVSTGTYSLEIAKKILESAKFLEYAKSIGVISNGNSYRISPKDINNYIFNVNEI